MNSMESIGVCSLDADSTTHSEGSLSPSNDQNAIIDNYSSSAYTLKSTSLILSNGRLSPLSKLGNPELRVEQFGDVVDRAAPSLDREESTPDKQTNSLMGKTNPTNNLDPDHLPSYLGISCAISGYSGYSRYCHSRDNSPARVTSMNSSKLSIASSKYPQNRDIDSAINESTFINGKPRSKTDSYICNKYFGSTTLSNVKAESNRNYVSSQNITLRKNSPASKNYYSNGLNGHHALSGEPKGRDEIRKVEFSTPGYEFDGRVDLTSEEPKSLVQQRIESLYGQPAGQVVQGGGIRLSRAKSRTPVDGNIANRSPSCPPQTFRPSSRSPPVFRHITKDFKEQLRNATVPTKIIPLKPQLSPNKQCASLTISPVAKKPLQNAFDSPSKQLLRASSEPKNLFPAALSVVPPLEEKNLVSPKEEIVSISVEIKKDGHYFLKMMAGTIEGFRSQIEQAKADADLPGVPEEAHGKLLSAVGLANLLIDSKFSQFRGLCEKNITPDDSEPFPTTNEDLAGFWDMLQYQVNKINEAFSNLRKLKERQWVEEEYEETVPYSRSKSHKKSQPKCNAKASVSNPTTPKHSSKANELAKARLEQRKKLMEAKKRGRQQNPGDADILIFTPDQAMDLK